MKENYIKRLEREKAQLIAALAEAIKGDNSIRSYLLSEKFWENTNVNRDDILLRLSESQRNITDLLDNEVYNAVTNEMTAQRVVKGSN